MGFPDLLVLLGKIGEGVVRYWPNELFLTFRGSYVCANFGEKSIKKCDRESAHRRTDTLTYTLVDANRFYNLSHAICYSYGTDKKKEMKRVADDRTKTCRIADYSTLNDWTELNLEIRHRLVLDLMIRQQMFATYLVQHVGV